MSKTIWKFKTPFEGNFSLQMPTQSEILCIQQDQKTMIPCIWAMVYPDNPKEERYFELYGTGHEINEDIGVGIVYIGTYQYQNGEFVGHLFERIN